MFDVLFPNWSNPAAVAAVVALRVLVDAGLVALVAGGTGMQSRRTVGAVVLTLLSATLMASVLRPGGAEQLGSYVELSFHLALFVLAGHATYSDPSRRRWLAFVALAVGAFLLLLPAVVLYGEATVAP